MADDNPRRLSSRATKSTKSYADVDDDEDYEDIEEEEEDNEMGMRVEAPAPIVAPQAVGEQPSAMDVVQEGQQEGGEVALRYCRCQQPDTGSDVFVHCSDGTKGWCVQAYGPLPQLT